MMIVWMSAISNHFLGPVETFFNYFADFTRMFIDVKVQLFNATFDFSYPFTSVWLLGFGYICVQIIKIITKTEEKTLELQRKSKLNEEIKINQELENSYKENTLAENKFILKVLLKETEKFKEISFDDSHFFIRRLLNLIKKQGVSFDYREKNKGITLFFDNFENIDKVIKCVNYWAENLLECNYSAVILLDTENAQNDFNKIFGIASVGKIMTDSLVKAKYGFLNEKSFNITSEGTFIIKNKEIELFRFN